jgi:hypothetical protein
MNAIVLNVVFGILGILVAVGIPVAGLFWQLSEESARRLTTTKLPVQRHPAVGASDQRLPRRDQPDPGQQRQKCPAPPHIWWTELEPGDSHDRTPSRA